MHVGVERSVSSGDVGVLAPARRFQDRFGATISVVGTALYNFTEGYGTYLIPAVLIVIMFQTLLMVIGMISGEERDSGTSFVSPPRDYPLAGSLG